MTHRFIFAVILLFILPFAFCANAASDSVSVNASFVVPSWISLSIVGNGDVGFGSIVGGGSYAGDNTTDLLVISTTSWAITSTIQWMDVSTVVPAGASISVIESAIGIPYNTSNTWGIFMPIVNYTMIVASNDMAGLPQGNYSLVIQYTAATD